MIGGPTIRSSGQILALSLRSSLRFAAQLKRWAATSWTLHNPRESMRYPAIGIMTLSLMCCERAPDYVFVPAENYKLSVQVVVPTTAFVNEWIPLKASRSSGPWTRVRRADLPPESRWFAEPPPSFEPEVADNLDWLTDPPGAGRYDLPTAATAGRTNERKVIFSKPGVYFVWGESAYPTKGKSNVATITIHHKP